MSLIQQVSSKRIEFVFFFFNDTATTEIYTLSLHDALPIFAGVHDHGLEPQLGTAERGGIAAGPTAHHGRSEEHTSELQSQSNLVCRLLLEKKKSAAIHGTARSTTACRARASGERYGTRLSC